MRDPGTRSPATQVACGRRQSADRTLSSTVLSHLWACCSPRQRRMRASLPKQCLCRLVVRRHAEFTCVPMEIRGSPVRRLQSVLARGPALPVPPWLIRTLRAGRSMPSAWSAVAYRA